MSALNDRVGRRESLSWLIAGAVVVLDAPMLWLYGCATTSASAEPVQVFQGTPEVQWSSKPDGNKTYLVYGLLRFKIPDEYLVDPYPLWTYQKAKEWWEKYDAEEFSAEQIKSIRPTDYLGSIGEMVVNADDFKPSSPKIRECFSYNRYRVECYENTIQIDIDTRMRKKDAYNEMNFSNYYIDPTRSSDFYRFITDPLTKKNEVYGLTRYHQPVYEGRSGTIEPYVENDIYLKLDGGNVITDIRCSNSDIKETTYNEPYYAQASKCAHGVINKKLKVYIYMTYSREYLPHWQRIQDNATALIEQFAQAAQMDNKRGQ